jgi:hypothetical protein
MHLLIESTLMKTTRYATPLRTFGRLDRLQLNVAEIPPKADDVINTTLRVED